MTTTINILEPLSDWYGVDPADVVGEIQSVANGDPIRVVMNCPGGDLFGALAIRNALNAHPAELSIEVIGLAASGGSLIMSLPRAHVTMRSGTWAMIHDPMSLVIGNAAQMRETADLLDRMAVDMANAYSGRMRQSADEVRDLMAAETWFSAAEALDCNLCDATDESDEPVAAQSEQAVKLLRTYTATPDEALRTGPSNDDLTALLEDFETLADTFN